MQRFFSARFCSIIYNLINLLHFRFRCTSSPEISFLRELARIETVNIFKAAAGMECGQEQCIWLFFFLSRPIQMILCNVKTFIGCHFRGTIKITFCQHHFVIKARTHDGMYRTEVTLVARPKFILFSFDCGGWEGRACWSKLAHSTVVYQNYNLFCIPMALPWKCVSLSFWAVQSLARVLHRWLTHFFRLLHNNAGAVTPSGR